MGAGSLPLFVRAIRDTAWRGATCLAQRCRWGDAGVEELLAKAALERPAIEGACCSNLCCSERGGV